VTRNELETAWDRKTSIPLLVLSLVFLVVYAMPIVAPTLNPTIIQACDISQSVIWAVFVVDFVGRFLLAEKKRLFLRRNIIELLAVAVPFLRPLRALRLLSVVTIGFRRFGSRLRNRVAFYVLGVAYMLWFIAGLAVTEAERGVQGANIQSVWDGWWWAFITLATVGYGDKYPVSPEGQWVAVVIVLTGIALLGTISATLAAWLVESGNETEKRILSDEKLSEETVTGLLAEVQALRTDVRLLSQQLQNTGAGGEGGP
jgi:voltage-gated potassium channel